MKNTILICLLSVGLFTQGIAQPGQRSRPTTEQKLERVSTQLESQMDLTPVKMEAVQGIYKSFFETMEKEREVMQKAMQNRRNELVMKRNEDLKDKLSKEEYAQIIALMENMRRDMKGNCPPGGKGPR